MNDDHVTPDVIRSLLDYNPDTGVLTWLPRSRDSFTSQRIWTNWTKRFSGKEAGSVRRSSHCRSYKRRHIVIGKRSFLAHRIAWAIYYGEWPGRTQQIDHINGDSLDNRISNLRLVDQVTNSRNQRMRHDNPSGVTGVRWDKATCKWVARIGFNGKIIHIGAFDSLLEATSARKSYEKRFGFHENHGAKRNTD